MKERVFGIWPAHWVLDQRGFERLLRYAEETGNDAGALRHLLSGVHKNKNKHFADILASGAVKPRAGFAELIHSLTRHDIRWAVVTTTSRSNWDALWSYSLSPLGLPAPTTIVVGDDVQAKKPDPEAYLLALQRLSLSAHDCYVIEDSRNGLLAAGGAGLPVAIVRSEFFADESFEGAAVVVDELTELVV